MDGCKVQKKKQVTSEEYNLNSLYINPTKYCNLRCKHCWVSPPLRDEMKGAEDEMSMCEIIDTIKEGRKLGLSSVKLTGGEPLLRSDIKELLEYCTSVGIEITIETNGTLITKSVAKMFKKSNMGQISVSLDSGREKMHDHFRGYRGAFRRTIEGINNLQDEGFDPQVIMSLYKENLNEFSEFMGLMQELRVYDIKINIISPIGRGNAMKESGLVPTVREIIEFSKEVEKNQESFKGNIYLDIPMAFKSLQTVKSGTCGICAIKNILGILSDGSVSLCGIGYMENDLVFGNVKNTPEVLKDIWNDNAIVKEIREGIPLKLEGVCGMCVFKTRCLGSCRAEIYYNTGKLFEPHWFCQEAYEEGLFPSTRLIPEALRKQDE